MSVVRCFAVALLSSTCLCAPAFAQSNPANGDIGTVDVQLATPGSTGKGQQGNILPPASVGVQDRPYSNSVVTREGLDNVSPTSNLAQDINKLPGVNAFSRDPSGIFGSGYSIRGFDSTNINLSVNGFSVSDPGTGQVLPHVYIDNENVCSIALGQLASNPTSNSALGAVGGSLDVTSCAPKEEHQATLEHTVGSFGLQKEFVRLDTGRYGYDGAFKTFISFSNTGTDVFAGSGSGSRQHIDAQTVWDIAPGDQITFNTFYNHQMNTFLRSPTLAQYNAQGYQGYGNTPPQVIGTAAQIGAAAAPTSAPGTSAANLYYKDFVEPGIWFGQSATGNFQLADNLKLTVTPHFFYQFSGSTSSYVNYSLVNGVSTAGGPVGVVNPGAPANATNVLAVGLNDSQITSGGINSALAWTVGAQTLTSGVNVERIRQVQQRPLEALNPDGSIPDPWFTDQSAFMKDVNGNVVSQKSWVTNQLIVRPFLADHIELLNKDLKIDAAVQVPVTNRRFENFPSDVNNSYQYYSVSRQFVSILPSLAASYNLTKEHQIFGSVSAGAQVPPSYADENLINPKTGAFLTPGKLVPETSLTFDLGYRYTSKMFGASFDVYHTDFKNRVATLYATDAATASIQPAFVNVGSTTKNGAEAALTINPIDNLHTFVTGSYTRDIINNNITGSDGVTQLATTGKQFFNTPNWVFSAGATYEVGAATYGIQTKYVSSVYSALLNDESIPGYNTVDLSFAYKLKTVALLDPVFHYAKDATFRVIANNIFDKHYLQLTGTGSAGPTLSAALTPPAYYYGSPFSVMASISATY